MNRKTRLALDVTHWTREDVQLLNDLISNLLYIMPVHDSIGQAAPGANFLRTGMLAYADGTNWNPSAGAGLYRYTGSAWEKVGNVTNGDSHDHSGGDGAQIDHTGLSNKGTNTHAQIDTHIATGAHVTNGDSHDHNGGDGAAITEAAITLADNTTNNVSTSKHGLCPKAPNDATKFLDGTGAFNLPYSEGTFTPTLIGSTTPGTQTYTAQYGRYKKIGKLVYISVAIIISAKDAAMAGNVLIGGLPFTSANVVAVDGITPRYYSGLTFASGYTQLLAATTANATTIGLFKAGSGAAGTTVLVSELGASSYVYVGGWYEAA